MVNRLLRVSKSNSFFLLGPRGTGKSTLLKRDFAGSEAKRTLYIDLLKPDQEDLYRRTPLELERQVAQGRFEWVIIDEIQKLPGLLDLVHSLIEEKKQKFILSGSSARKLKRGSANLLAGRAFVYHLHALTAAELGENFSLDLALAWGLLPKVLTFRHDEERADYLRSYAYTYLKEEVQAEQLVRKLDPFRDFLEIAAQMNGKIINYSKIAQDVGVDTTTVQNYFSIIEETLLGFYLPSFHKSVRKRQRLAPKFYFFDPGVARALSRNLDLPLKPQTSAYGDAFEHFIILEIRKLAEYQKLDWRFSYLRTKDDVEIDLIIDRPGKPVLCLEIKSSTHVRESDLRHFSHITSDLKAQAWCLSRDKIAKSLCGVECLPWQEGLQKLFAAKRKRSG